MSMLRDGRRGQGHENYFVIQIRIEEARMSILRVRKASPFFRKTISEQDLSERFPLPTTRV